MYEIGLEIMRYGLQCLRRLEISQSGEQKANKRICGKPKCGKAREIQCPTQICACTERDFDDKVDN